MKLLLFEKVMMNIRSSIENIKGHQLKELFFDDKQIQIIFNSY